MSQVRIVPLRRIKIGSMVRCDILSQSGTLLFRKDHILTEPVVQKLENMGVYMVVVEIGAVQLEGEGFSEAEKEIVEADLNTDNIDEYKESFNLKEEFEKGRQALQDKDVDGAHEVASEIAKKLVDLNSMKAEIEALKFGTEGVVTHSLNVAVLAGAIGVENKFKFEDIETLVVGGMLHDIGKLYIEPEILNKNGKLTDEEYEIMKNHTVEGYNKLSENNHLDEKVRQMALQHHENNDGTGYPKGLTSRQIYWEAKIIHLVDVYEAMTARRCYKDQVLPGDVIEFIMGRYATMFDPRAIDLFLKTIPAYKRGAIVRLSDGSRCRVLDSNPINSLRPIVINLDTGKIINLYKDMESLSLTIVGMDNDKGKIIMHDENQV